MMSLQRTTGKKIPVHWCKSSLESQWQFEGNKIQKANTQELPFFPGVFIHKIHKRKKGLESEF
jgi:hypothetical protein